MNCPYKWTNSTDAEEDQGELEGEKAGRMVLAQKEQNHQTGWTRDQQSITLPRLTRMSKRLED